MGKLKEAFGAYAFVKDCYVFYISQFSDYFKNVLIILPLIIILEMAHACLVLASTSVEFMNWWSILLLVWVIKGLLYLYLFAIASLPWFKTYLLRDQKLEKIRFGFKGEEWRFFLALVFFYVSYIALEAGLVVLTLYAQEPFLTLTVLVDFYLIIALICVYLRMSLYLPAKAIGSDLRIKEAWILGKGYFWKILSRLFIVNLCVILLFTGCYIALLIVGTYFVALAGGGSLALLIFDSLLKSIFVFLIVFLVELPINSIILSELFQESLKNQLRKRVRSKAATG